MTVDFQNHPFRCPYCNRETMVQLPPEMDTIMMGRATCEYCDRDFLIENDAPSPLPQ